MLRIRCLGAAAFTAVLAVFTTANADDLEIIKTAYAGVDEITVFASAGGIANVPQKGKWVATWPKRDLVVALCFAGLVMVWYLVVFEEIGAIDVI